jgi:hypothetical protein
MPESVEKQNKEPFPLQFRAPWATLVEQDWFALRPIWFLASLSPCGAGASATLFSEWNQSTRRCV